MATFISNSPAETEALAEGWGRAAQSGLVIGLSGDLGAGKTQFVKGFARGLGIIERIHSPTFALVNIYTSGRLPCFHLDLYRLETPEQIASAGIEQYLQPDGVALIEWAERLWPELRPQPASPSSPVAMPGTPDLCGRNLLQPVIGALPFAQIENPKSRIENSITPSLQPSNTLCRFRWVRINELSETSRQIDYEDFGA